MNRWQVGKARVTQVVEIGLTPTSPRFFFKDPPPDLVARHGWLKPHFANDDGKLLASIHCLRHRIGGAAHRGRHLRRQRQEAQQSRVERAATGRSCNTSPRRALRPSRSTPCCARTCMSITWAGTRARVGGRWVPTFPKARAICSRAQEWEHWARGGATKPRATAATILASSDDVLGDSVRPIIDAGLAELVDTDHRLTEEIWLAGAHPATRRATSACASSPAVRLP